MLVPDILIVRPAPCQMPEAGRIKDAPLYAGRIFLQVYDAVRIAARCWSVQDRRQEIEETMGVPSA